MGNDLHVAEPGAVSGLPRDKHGRRIPWFVHVDEHGVPDFRVVREHGVVAAFRGNLCWVCGADRGRESAFVIGPMCTVNRVAPEPPSHRACATYSANACPFLTTPAMRRRENGLPEERFFPGGEAIMHNPGVTAVWFSRGWKPFRTPDGGVLFDVGEPSRVSWYAHGRRATREEVLAAFDKGMPTLRGNAEKEGADSIADLTARHAHALRLIPRPAR